MQTCYSPAPAALAVLMLQAVSLPFLCVEALVPYLPAQPSAPCQCRFPSLHSPENPAQSPHIFDHRVGIAIAKL